MHKIDTVIALTCQSFEFYMELVSKQKKTSGNLLANINNIKSWLWCDPFVLLARRLCIHGLHAEP